jgi:hypothetical protein
MPDGLASGDAEGSARGAELCPRTSGVLPRSGPFTEDTGLPAGRAGAEGLELPVVEAAAGAERAAGTSAVGGPAVLVGATLALAAG